MEIPPTVRRFVHTGLPVAPATILAFLALAACSGDDPAGPGDRSVTAVPPGADPVEYERIPEVRSGSIREAEGRRTLVTDENTWRAVWAELTADREPAPPVPEVDFASRSVVLAAMGSRGSSGYDIEVLGVAREDDILYVVVEETSPGLGCVTLAVMTAPATAVSVAGPVAEVRFVEREVVMDCDPAAS